MKLFALLKTRFVVWVWNHTPNCAEMSRLTSRSLDESLPLKLRVQMWLHHLICIWCQRYFRQLNFLHQAGAKFDLGLPQTSGRSLSPEARQRITQRIRGADDFSGVRTDC